MQSTIFEIENAVIETAQSTESAKGVVEANPSPLPPQQNSTPPSPQHNPIPQASQTNQTETVLAMAGFEKVQGPGLPGHSGITTQSSHQNNQPSVKLPKLSLKKFSGDITTWSTFWDTFELQYIRILTCQILTSSIIVIHSLRIQQPMQYRD